MAAQEERGAQDKMKTTMVVLATDESTVQWGHIGDSRPVSYTHLKGKKAEKLSDDVNDYYAFGENSVAMLTEYNYDRMKGDLRYYNGKETYMVDTDVRNFFRTY